MPAYLQNLVQQHFPDIFQASDVAVAVSGGPDSLALAHALSHLDGPFKVHALIVDHGLREESAQEAQHVMQMIATWPKTQACILHWDHDGVHTKLQEQARQARYDLMASYCQAHDVSHLFLGHHMDDQAETILFRLAKGSGLDGLCGMQAHQNYNDVLTLCRPFLDVPKNDLIQYCEGENLDYVQDPSNEKDEFARVRMRKSWHILEEEGLSSKRVSVLSKRLNNIRKALRFYSEKLAIEALIERKAERIVYDLRGFKKAPFEIVLRVICDVLQELQPASDYGPRREKVEALVTDVLKPTPFQKRTLGGCVFTRDDINQLFMIEKE